LISNGVAVPTFDQTKTSDDVNVNDLIPRCVISENNSKSNAPGNLKLGYGFVARPTLTAALGAFSKTLTSQ
jgi:hypothetical protein